ncbi:hypothetical protein GDO81_019171 [Engystomops pustulosus]|uniref:Uncharacterized protein n=1 Tax=Engystomops pustulosus TaxID=76066 RepID=A0AAV6YBD1_ENGPU|nr:hypothetical protein GDO81_019171 [Engystomops pustulosus]
MGDIMLHLLNSKTSSHLFPVLIRVPPGPEEMGRGAHSSALIRLLQQLGGCQGALCPQRLMVFFTKTFHLLKCSNYEGDRRQLCLRVTDFIFIQ